MTPAGSWHAMALKPRARKFFLMAARLMMVKCSIISLALRAPESRTRSSTPSPLTFSERAVSASSPSAATAREAFFSFAIFAMASAFSAVAA